MAVIDPGEGAEEETAATGLANSRRDLFVQRTRVLDFFTPDQVAVLWRMTSMPAGGAGENMMRLLRTTFDYALQLVPRTPFIYRRWLRTPSRMRGADVRPFSPPQERNTLEKYFASWARFVVFVFVAKYDAPAGLGFDLYYPPEIAALMDELESSWHSSDLETKTKAIVSINAAWMREQYTPARDSVLLAFIATVCWSDAEYVFAYHTWACSC